MATTYDIYRSCTGPGFSLWILSEVAVPAERARGWNAGVAVPHGEAGPDGWACGRPMPTPFSPANAALVQAHAARERQVVEMVGDLSGLTARQRKRRRQAARATLPSLQPLEDALRAELGRG